MGRKGKYETHVLPHLSDIRAWYEDFSEAQIATKMLKVSVASWGRYKAKHPELREALKEGKQALAADLKAALKKRARGYYYTERRSYAKDEGGKKTKYTETVEKYMAPDTAAIHLLLKNLDPEWRNDDQTTIDLKRKQTELTERKLDQGEW